MIFNGKSFQDPRNINLKGGVTGTGLIRWNPPVTGSSGPNWATNPFGTLDYGLYINTDGRLVYSYLGTTIVLGSGGASSVPSWDAIYAGDQTLAVSSTTFTIDGTHASNDVLTITDTTAGSGDLIQITNTGSGFDVNGTASTWNFTKAGVNTMKSTTIAGTAGSDSFTLTAGDMVLSDGSITVTDADNAATLSITNNTATTASVFVFAGSAAFTGNTTSSFMTLTSGATTGTVLYIPVTALTTGKGINLLGTTALTTGIILNVESGTTGTSLTGAGRLFKVAHTGTGTSNGILSEFASAAIDETVIAKITASGALALGTALAISASSMTTGYGLTLGDLDALTTGYGIYVASAATAITSAGHLVYSHHTGTTGTSAVLNLFDTAATDETVVVGITASAALALGKALSISAASMTTGSGVSMVDLDALTTGKGLHIASAATAITGAGRLVYVNHTGATGTTAILAEFASAANDETVILKVTASDILAAGTGLSISVAAMTTGTALAIGTLAALTTGIGLSIASSATAITGAGRLLYVNHTGISGTSAILSEFTSAATDETIVLKATATGAITGTVMQVGAAATITGKALEVIGTAATLTTGRYISISDSATEVFGIGANGHIHTTQTTAPTVGALTQHGITAAAVTAGATDVCGQITTTGTQDNTADSIIPISFHKTYTNAPKAVVLQPINAAAASGLWYISAISATGFSIGLVKSAAWAATPSFAYIVIA